MIRFMTEKHLSTLVYSNETTRRYIPEGRHLRSSSWGLSAAPTELSDHGTQMLINALTKAGHWTQQWASLNQPSPSHLSA
jgi:hypothetical protein